MKKSSPVEEKKMCAAYSFESYGARGFRVGPIILSSLQLQGFPSLAPLCSWRCFHPIPTYLRPEYLPRPANHVQKEAYSE